MTLLRLFLPVFFLISASSATASSTQPVRVLELFTSQGCSSCPPANRFAGQIAKDQDTLVLSYGVTYWDYLGWKDTFAKPEFTRRQKDYVRALGSANVYTPQMILNGSAHGSRYSKRDVRSMTIRSNDARIALTSHNGILEVSQDSRMTAKSYEAVLVEYVPGPQSVPVNRGENGGQVLTLTNVVTSVLPLGRWRSNGTLKTSVRPRVGKAYSILLHDPTSMKIVAAATYSNRRYK